MASPRAFIAGCAGQSLTAEEVAFFRDADPLGFILFRRNIADPDQVRALTAALREAVGRADAPVLVDQEGGRVQRLGPPHWPRYPAGRAYGRLAADLAGRSACARTGARLIAHDLRSVGIDVDCLPVLDVPVPGAHDIIGDRAYDTDPAAVAVLGRAAAEGLLAGGVLPVVKHIPGHGRAGVDSHESLPRVSASLAELRAQDFPPFRALADMPIAMTAHVVYEAIDPDRPATTSPLVVSEIIRGEIGFGGLLLTDDLSMRALSGSFRERAEAALRAGVDVVLHCNGDLAEARAVAEAAPRLSGESARRVAAAQARIAGPPPAFDVVDARRGFEAALAEAA
ncbi:beta-N-acetylhexosaminidase [Enterovirga aerilata]|uniref:beta-N-acetylhexosaminidase n=1 Tax=Enterovirga aerilata TaxID=2730920 RepID=A0A849I7L9_9HYPH|nr:beta-N-acetylhexosaminidase [Enterovirga sp. DB1703]